LTPPGLYKRFGVDQVTPPSVVLEIS
jgi:hypothetical protein